MGKLIANVGNCPLDVLQESMQEQSCLDITKSIRRLALFNLDQATVDPFGVLGAGTTATQSDLKTAIELEANWDTAIALADESRLTLTPRIYNWNEPAVSLETIDRPDGSKGLNPIFPSSLVTADLTGLSPTNHARLMQMMNAGGLGALLVDFSGNAIGKTLTDAEVAADNLPFFKVETFIVGTRQRITGQEDMVQLTLSFVYDELVEYTIYDTSSFLLSK